MGTLHIRPPPPPHLPPTFLTHIGARSARDADDGPAGFGSALDQFWIMACFGSIQLGWLPALCTFLLQVSSCRVIQRISN